jgi:hypothetical protein
MKQHFKYHRIAIPHACMGQTLAAPKQIPAAVEQTHKPSEYRRGKRLWKQKAIISSGHARVALIEVFGLRSLKLPARPQYARPDKSGRQVS